MTPRARIEIRALSSALVERAPAGPEAVHTLILAWLRDPATVDHDGLRRVRAARDGEDLARAAIAVHEAMAHKIYAADEITPEFLASLELDERALEAEPAPEPHPETDVGRLLSLLLSEAGAVALKTDTGSAKFFLRAQLSGSRRPPADLTAMALALAEGALEGESQAPLRRRAWRVRAGYLPLLAAAEAGAEHLGDLVALARETLAAEVAASQPKSRPRKPRAPRKRPFRIDRRWILVTRALSAVLVATAEAPASGADPLAAATWSRLSRVVDDVAAGLGGACEHMARVLGERRDDDSVASAADDVHSEAEDAWDHLVDRVWWIEDGGWGRSETKRQRHDAALAKAWAEAFEKSRGRVLPSEAFEALGPELELAGVPALDDPDEDPDALVALMSAEMALTAGDRWREARRVALVRHALGAAAALGDERADRAAAAALQLLASGWPTEQEEARGWVPTDKGEVPASLDVPASDLLGPLVKRVHAPDWVSWRSDLPEVRAVLDVPSKRLPELFAGVMRLLLAPRALGLPASGRDVLRVALRALLDKRMAKARFVLDEAQLTGILQDLEPDTALWIQEHVAAAVGRSARKGSHLSDAGKRAAATLHAGLSADSPLADALKPLI